MSGSNPQWADYGFVPASPVPGSAPADAPPSWEDMGFSKVQAAPITTPKIVGQDPDGNPIFEDEAANREINDTNARASEKFLKGATFGLAPFAEAAVKSVATGQPYSEALKDVRNYSDETSKNTPIGSAIMQGAGAFLPTAPLSAGVGAAGKALSAGNKYGEFLVNTAGSGLMGAGAAAGEDIGSGHTDTVGADAAKGGAFGAAAYPLATIIGRGIQAIPNMVNGVVTGAKNILTSGGKDAVAGQILREASGDFVNDAATSPIPGLTLRTAQATNNPGLDSLDGMLASTPGTRATLAENLVHRGRTAAQTNALEDALIGESAVRADPATMANQRSFAGVQAIHGANDALREVERGLWTAPALKDVKLNGPDIANGVAGDVANYPASWRDAITGPQNTLGAFLKELHEKGPNASIPDINSIRSRLMAEARAAAGGASPDPVKAAAAGKMADDILTRIGSDPAIAGAPAQTFEAGWVNQGGGKPMVWREAGATPEIPANPEAWNAYQTARDFTRNKNTALGYNEFNNILHPNNQGNIQSNPEQAFGAFFDPVNGTRAGMDRLQGVSDLLRANGRTAEADALDEASRNYARAALWKQARAGGGLDATGGPAMNVSTLATTANKMAPALENTPMMAGIAPDVQNVGEAARLVNRTGGSLRGDVNSTTYEKLRNNDLVNAIIGQTGSSAMGAAAGGVAAGVEGPDSIPWYLRVPGGMMAGAILGSKGAPLLSKAIPKWASEPYTNDILSRVGTGLNNLADYQRLTGIPLQAGPRLLAPGRLSDALVNTAPFVAPVTTSAGGR